jgi:hypothetical protein
MPAISNEIPTAAPRQPRSIDIQPLMCTTGNTPNGTVDAKVARVRSYAFGAADVESADDLEAATNRMGGAPPQTRRSCAPSDSPKSRDCPNRRRSAIVGKRHPRRTEHERRMHDAWMIFIGALQTIPNRNARIAASARQRLASAVAVLQDGSGGRE